MDHEKSSLFGGGKRWLVQVGLMLAQVVGEMKYSVVGHAVSLSPRSSCEMTSLRSGLEIRGFGCLGRAATASVAGDIYVGQRCVLGFLYLVGLLVLAATCLVSQALCSALPAACVESCVQRGQHTAV